MEWISVTDNVPDKHKRVLVYDANFKRPLCCEKTTILIASLGKGMCDETYSWETDDVCHDNETIEVTHWMFLPNEPK